MKHINIITKSESSLNLKQEQFFVNECKEELNNGVEKEKIIKHIKEFMIMCQTGYRTYPIINAFLNELEK